jgi:hypothetical protein
MQSQSAQSRFAAFIVFVLSCSFALGNVALSAEVLPPGVKAVWDIGKAHKQTTPTREMICINGLWQWQPVVGDGRQQTADGSRESATASPQPPTDNWGYFKVPGPIPGTTDWMQKDSQLVYAHPSWKDTPLGNVTKMWYQREIEIPQNWKDRHIFLKASYVNSRAVVYITPHLAGTPGSPDTGVPAKYDTGVPAKLVGEILYPAGEVDLTAVCTPGKKYLLSIEVTALPIAEVIALFGDTNAPKQGAATVNRRGLCGDVFLASEPKGPKITDVRIETSVRKGEITVTAKVPMAAIPVALPATDDELWHTGEVGYALVVSVLNQNEQQVYRRSHDIDIDTADWAYGTTVPQSRVLHFSSQIVDGNDTISVTHKWKPDKLWDIHTSENMYKVVVELIKFEDSLVPKRHTRQDVTPPIPFGFREFWIDGRDLYLNGTKIWLSCVPLDNAQDRKSVV